MFLFTGVSYSNCSSASYCMTFSETLTGSFLGFNVSAITATCVWDLQMEFADDSTCQTAAANNTQVVCGGDVQSTCNGASFAVTACGGGDEDYGTIDWVFSEPMPGSFSFSKGDC